jgi:hypothetical protein
MRYPQIDDKRVSIETKADRRSFKGKGTDTGVARNSHGFERPERLYLAIKG